MGRSISGGKQTAEPKAEARASICSATAGQDRPGQREPPPAVSVSFWELCPTAGSSQRATCRAPSPCPPSPGEEEEGG